MIDEAAENIKPTHLDLINEGAPAGTWLVRASSSR
jgi:hypothetical protein